METRDSVSVDVASQSALDARVVASRLGEPPFFLQSYRPSANIYDEMWVDGATTIDGIRPHWHGAIRAFAALGTDDIERMQQEALWLLHDNGVTYNVHGVSDGHQRPWPLDLMPLVIHEDDWSAIATARRRFIT